MDSDHPSPGLLRRLYINMFKIFGPADYQPVGEPPQHNPNDPTVPAGFHLETVTQADGVKKRIMVPDNDDQR